MPRLSLAHRPPKGKTKDLPSWSRRPAFRNSEIVDDVVSRVAPTRLATRGAQRLDVAGDPVRLQLDVEASLQVGIVRRDPHLQVYRQTAHLLHPSDKGDRAARVVTV